MEYFEVFDESGELKGTAPREEVHAAGYWHRCSNILVQRSNGDLLIQLRAEDKDVFPGTWDFSVCEHLKPGEQFPEAAIRGLAEELDITDCTVEPITGVYRSEIADPDGKIRDNEFQQCFLARYDGPVKLDKEEVSDFTYISPEQLKIELKQGNRRFTPWLVHFIETKSGVFKRLS
jgi:isopentenyl-diphosphate delta-isomerase